MPKILLDRRVQKTRKLLQDALIDLVSVKSFDLVTIQEILDKANVGRSTFYTHFQDKHELLHSCFEELSKLFEQTNLSPLEYEKSIQDRNNFDFVFNTFQFVERNPHLIKALLGRPGIAMLDHPICDYLLAYMCEALKRSKSGDKRSSLQNELAANYLVSALVGILRWWLQNDMPCTAVEMDRYFKHLSMNGFIDISVECSL